MTGFRHISQVAFGLAFLATGSTSWAIDLPLVRTDTASNAARTSGSSNAHLNSLQDPQSDADNQPSYATSSSVSYVSAGQESVTVSEDQVADIQTAQSSITYIPDHTSGCLGMASMLRHDGGGGFGSAMLAEGSGSSSTLAVYEVLTDPVDPSYDNGTLVVKVHPIVDGLDAGIRMTSTSSCLVQVNGQEVANVTTDYDTATEIANVHYSLLQEDGTYDVGNFSTSGGYEDDLFAYKDVRAEDVVSITTGSSSSIVPVLISTGPSISGQSNGDMTVSAHIINAY